jgi:hypothetical protein
VALLQPFQAREVPTKVVFFFADSQTEGHVEVGVDAIDPNDVEQWHVEPVDLFTQFTH